MSTALKGKVAPVVAMSAAIAFLPLAAAHAVPLIYEEGPNYGQPFVAGPVTIKLTNFEVGTVYPNYAPGTGFGFGALGADASVCAGVTTLDGLATSPAGSLPLGPCTGVDPNGPNREDSWGIAKVTRIEDVYSDALWTPAGKGQEITVLFYGEQDFYLEQVNADEQWIDGAGMRADLYSEPLPTATAFNATGGTGARTAANTYPTVTDGTLILTTISVPGHIHQAGVAGGLATEFEARFNGASLTGDGEAFLSVTGGADAAQFNHDTFAPLAAGLPTADIRVQFDTAPTPVADWLVTSWGPIVAQVPEPGSLALLVVGAAVLAVRRRRR
jgi:hypothetical protein